MDTNPESHAFSIELKNTNHLKTIAIPFNRKGTAVIEGFLGELINVGFVEDSLLEIHGENGVFRIDMKPEEASKITKSKGEMKL